MILSAPRWVVTPPPDPAIADRLGRALKLPRALAALLAQRGHTEEDEVRRFLRPALEDLEDPLRLRDMDRAASLVAGAIRAGQTILVHGDYDVDGQCATALLTRVLRLAGGTVVPFVPHRLRDGYDFGAAGLAAAKAAGASLILTCDCGISAIEAVAAAKAAGLTVVVTDHHLPGERLPPADAVVDPQRADDDSGAVTLCGTGIAFKLAQAVVAALGLPAALPFHFLDLVALATVADVVPLTGENRVLVRHGLRLMGQTRWPGLAALLRAGRLDGKELRASHLGFIVGPRLNAAGRIGEAMDGLRLLLTDDAAEAATLATRLEDWNRERQTMDTRMLEDAIRMASEGFDPERDAALVLAGEGWHPGVVGIVASRIVERFGRPAFLIGMEGELGKGSGRSISAFDLHEALVACGDLLERYGGHHMAAGLTIRRDRLEAFRKRFRDVARARLTPEDLVPEQRVDVEIGLDEATGDLERLCRYLEPCGMGNPGPVFGVRGVRLDRATVVGEKHLRGRLAAGGVDLEAIAFNFAERRELLEGGTLDAAFRLELNDFRGQTSLQARVVALAPHRPAA